MAPGLNEINWLVVLKEYADKKKVSCHYDDMRSSGPQHDLTFHVKINLGTFTAEGTGKTKKAAKAHAAQLLMELINPGGNNPQGDISMRKGDQRGNANFVGELQVSDRVPLHTICNVYTKDTANVLHALYLRNSVSRRNGLCLCTRRKRVSLCGARAVAKSDCQWRSTGVLSPYM